jgi:hypothetical protein
MWLASAIGKRLDSEQSIAVNGAQAFDPPALTSTESPKSN